MTPSRIDWSPFYDQLRRYVAARVAARAEVDDLVQLILERAIARSEGAAIESSVGWLFGIARNAISDHYRGRARAFVQAADALDELEGVAEPSGDERAEVVACMEPLLSSLPPGVAQVLRWADMEGWSMQAIGEELDISLTAAKSRVRRARQDFVDATKACCAITVDARSRVTGLEPRRGCGGPCRSCGPGSGTTH